MFAGKQKTHHLIVECVLKRFQREKKKINPPSGYTREEKNHSPGKCPSYLPPFVFLKKLEILFSLFSAELVALVVEQKMGDFWRRKKESGKKTRKAPQVKSVQGQFHISYRRHFLTDI